MGRIAYQIITSIHEEGTEARGLALVKQTLLQLKQQGIATRVILQKGMPSVEEADGCLYGTPGVIVDDLCTRKDRPDEVWVFTDDLFGPVCPLDRLTLPVGLTQPFDGHSGEGIDKTADGASAVERPNQASGAWYLARGAGFYCLRGDQAVLPKVRAWLEKGMTEAGFLKLGLHAVEKINTEDLGDNTVNPMLDQPHRMLREKGCPFIRHEVFHRPYDDVISTTLGHMAQVLYLDLIHRCGYDVAPLWQFLTGTCHQEDLFWNMKLLRTLSTVTHDEQKVKGYLKGHRVALGMHLYYPDLFRQSYEYACHFPPETDVYITTSDDGRKRQIEEIFADLPVRRLTVRAIGNRGRDVSALLIGMKEVMAYDCVCFYHDKKVMQVSPRSIGNGFAFTTAENLLPNGKFVRNMIALFQDEPYLGIASPPPPNHGDYYFTMGSSWGPNYASTFDLYTRLGLTVPISQGKMPIAPLGTCFWFRGKALEALFSYPWTYEDFPREPNQVDGTILHAVERIYPYVALEAGYYPIHIYSDRFAAMQYTHFRHYIRGYQQVMGKHGIMNKQPVMREMLKKRLREKGLG